jgi:hypothetical protein
LPSSSGPNHWAQELNLVQILLPRATGEERKSAIPPQPNHGDECDNNLSSASHPVAQSPFSATLQKCHRHPLHRQRSSLPTLLSATPEPACNRNTKDWNTWIEVTNKLKQQTLDAADKAHLAKLEGEPAG